MDNKNKIIELDLPDHILEKIREKAIKAGVSDGKICEEILKEIIQSSNESIISS